MTLPRVEDEHAWEGPVSLADLPLLSGPLRTARFGFDAEALAAWEPFGPSAPAARARPHAEAAI